MLIVLRSLADVGAEPPIPPPLLGQGGACGTIFAALSPDGRGVMLILLVILVAYHPSPDGVLRKRENVGSCQMVTV